jgi:Hydrogenase formation hypA family
LKVARQNQDRKVIFLAIGFETTAPANAMAAWQAKRDGLRNFSVLVSHVLVPPAIRALMASPQNRVQAFIAPGHVCTVMGCREYENLVRDFRVPMPTRLNYTTRCRNRVITITGSGDITHGDRFGNVSPFTRNVEVFHEATGREN